MSLPGITAKTQQELVEQTLAAEPKITTEVLRPPGIDKLHQRPIEEIAAVLANLLKSRRNIAEFTYRTGECVVIKYF